MGQVSLTITNEDLFNACIKITKDPEMAKFIANVISDSPNAVSLFMHIFMGGKFPEMPNIGDSGYVLIESLFWKEDREKYASHEQNKHGFIPVTINTVSSVHSSYPLSVDLPDGKTISIGLNMFIPEPNSDIVRE